MQQLRGLAQSLGGSRGRVALGLALIAVGFAVGGSAIGFGLTLLGVLTFWTGMCGRCVLGSCPPRRNR